MILRILEITVFFITRRAFSRTLNDFPCNGRPGTMGLSGINYSNSPSPVSLQLSRYFFPLLEAAAVPYTYL